MNRTLNKPVFHMEAGNTLGVTYITPSKILTSKKEVYKPINHKLQKKFMVKNDKSYIKQDLPHKNRYSEISVVKKGV